MAVACEQSCFRIDREYQYVSAPNTSSVISALQHGNNGCRCLQIQEGNPISPEGPTIQRLIFSEREAREAQKLIRQVFKKGEEQVQVDGMSFTLEEDGHRLRKDDILAGKGLLLHKTEMSLAMLLLGKIVHSF